jgi:hypothetical protein
MARLRHWPLDLLGDRPAADAAKLMGLTPAEFDEVIIPLRVRGFPAPDPTTGLYDLDAIVRWRRMRHPRLFGLADFQPQARDAADLAAERRARRAQERKERAL